MEANDMKAMREALLCILDIAERDMPNYCRSRARDQGESESIRAWSNTIVEIASKALALPRRQCDVGTAEEQSERFAQYCGEHDSKRFCGDCPNRYNPKNCGIFWAQMPYEEGGAE